MADLICWFSSPEEKGKMRFLFSFSQKLKRVGFAKNMEKEMNFCILRGVKQEEHVKLIFELHQKNPQSMKKHWQDK